MDTVTIIIGTGILFYALTCLALFDIVGKEFRSIVVKAAWGFTVMIPFIGCIIYFLVGYRQGKKKSK